MTVAAHDVDILATINFDAEAPCASVNCPVDNTESAVAIIRAFCGCTVLVGERCVARFRAHIAAFGRTQYLVECGQCHAERYGIFSELIRVIPI